MFRFVEDFAARGLIHSIKTVSIGLNGIPDRSSITVQRVVSKDNPWPFALSHAHCPNTPSRITITDEARPIGEYFAPLLRFPLYGA